MPSTARGAASGLRSTAPASRSSTAIARRACISSATRIPTSTRRREKGWLDKLAFWKSDDVKPEQYRVVVTQADPKSVVTVQDPAGAPDKSVNSDKILALLKDQLK